MLLAGMLVTANAVSQNWPGETTGGIEMRKGDTSRSSRYIRQTGSSRTLC